jgi:hypothetical protein
MYQTNKKESTIDRHFSANCNTNKLPSVSCTFFIYRGQSSLLHFVFHQTMRETIRCLRCNLTINKMASSSSSTGCKASSNTCIYKSFIRSLFNARRAARDLDVLVQRSSASAKEEAANNMHDRLTTPLHLIAHEHNN